MCTDAMATGGRKQRERRPNWWRTRKTVWTPAVEVADGRKYVGKLLRRSGRRSRSLAWEKEKQKSAHALPSGAMAPRNTTQYLMELTYSDLNITASSSGLNTYLRPEQTRCVDEDSVDFQYRDFERVFLQHEIGTDAILKAAILETEPLDTFKTTRMRSRRLVALRHVPPPRV